MMFRLYKLLFFIALIDCVASSTKTVPNGAFGRLHGTANVPDHVRPVLEIGRGGAGPLDPVLVEKTNAVLQLGQAAPLFLSPSTAAKLYGFRSNPLLLKLIEKVFTTLLSYALGMYCVVFQGTSTTTALAYSSIPWFVTCLKHLLDGTSITKSGDVIGVGLSVLGIYTGLTNPSNADSIVLGLSIWNIANGLLMGVAPMISIQGYGVPVRSGDTAEISMTRAIGWFLLGHGVYFYTLISGKGDSMQAMGYSMMTHFAHVASSLFIFKDFDKLGIDKAPFFVWLVEHLCVISTLAFPEKTTSTPL